MNFKTAPARIILFLLVLFTLPPLTGCSNNMAGAVSETTNGAVSTTLIGSDNQIIDSAEIKLIPRDYLFGEDSTIIIHSCSLSDGQFTFKNKISSGEYNLHIKSNDFSHIIKTVYDSVLDTFTNIDDSIYLKKSASFAGQVFMPFIDYSPTDTFYINPVGIDMYSEIDSLGYFSFNSLPISTTTFKVFIKSGDSLIEHEAFDSIDTSFEEGEIVTDFHFLPNSDFRVSVAVIRHIYDTHGKKGVEVTIGSSFDPVNLKGLGIKKVPTIIKYLKTSHLYLSNNNIDTMTDEFFELPNLEILDLSNNQITSIPPSIVKAKELRYLDLQDNPLTSLPNEIMSMDSLSVDLNKTLLTNLSDELKKWLDNHSAGSPNWITREK